MALASQFKAAKQTAPLAPQSPDMLVRVAAGCNGRAGLWLGSVAAAGLRLIGGMPSKASLKQSRLSHDAAGVCRWLCAPRLPLWWLPPTGLPQALPPTVPAPPPSPLALGLPAALQAAWS